MPKNLLDEMMLRAAADWHRPWTDELERRRLEIAKGCRLDCEKLRAKLAAARD